MFNTGEDEPTLVDDLFSVLSLGYFSPHDDLISGTSHTLSLRLLMALVYLPPMHNSDGTECVNGFRLPLCDGLEGTDTDQLHSMVQYRELLRALAHRAEEVECGIALSHLVLNHARFKRYIITCSDRELAQLLVPIAGVLHEASIDAITEVYSLLPLLLDLTCSVDFCSRLQGISANVLKESCGSRFEWTDDRYKITYSCVPCYFPLSSAFSQVVINDVNTVENVELTLPFGFAHS